MIRKLKKKHEQDLFLNTDSYCDDTGIEITRKQCADLLEIKKNS